jgi:hypothetical protein
MDEGVGSAMKVIVAAVFASAALAAAAPAFAQDAQSREPRDSRYQIGMMEGVLEKAVEHGAALMRERLQKVLPADMLLSQPVRVRGVRLDGYGVIFDIDVPSLQSAPIWSLQTLDQNNLGLDSAINALRAHVDASGDANLQQALQRMELAVSPFSGLPSPTLVGSSQAAGAVPPARQATGSALATDDSTVARVASDPLLNNPGEWQAAYHAEITDALKDAVLDHSRGLAIAAGERLTIVAGGTDSQPLTGLNDDTPIAVISIKGSDLAEFLGNRISHDEARQRIQMKVF